MKYKDCIDIKPSLCTAWLIKFKDKTQVTLWHKDAKIEDVINYVKAISDHGTELWVSRLDNGLFTIIKDDDYHLYSEDARMVNQDMEVEV